MNMACSGVRKRWSQECHGRSRSRKQQTGTRLSFVEAPPDSRTRSRDVDLLRLPLRALAHRASALRHRVLQPGQRQKKQRGEHVTEKEVDPDERRVKRTQAESH